MGFFDKKFCDICGEKISLLGNRKLEDGNMCKDCALTDMPMQQSVVTQAQSGVVLPDYGQQPYFGQQPGYTQPSSYVQQPVQTQNTQRFCTNCGAANTARFCSECGTPRQV